MAVREVNKRPWDPNCVSSRPLIPSLVFVVLRSPDSFRQLSLFPPLAFSFPSPTLSTLTSHFRASSFHTTRWPASSWPTAQSPTPPRALARPQSAISQPQP